MTDTFQEIIKKISEELNLEFSLLSNDYIIALSSNKTTKVIIGHKFDLNLHGTGLVFDDKYALYELLKKQDIKIIEHNIVYGVNNKNSYALSCNNMDYLKELFEKYNGNVVLKINHGTCGVNVEHIESLSELEEKFLKMANKSNSLSLCPYYEIENEFRAIVLDNEIKLIYKKEKPVVVGDGVSTIKKLLTDFNPSYFKEIDNKELDAILKKGEYYTYDWKFNLSRGARLNEEVSDTDKHNICEIVSSISKKLYLGFCSVDVIKTNGKYYVLEINSGVMMKNYIEQAKDGYNTAYNIYKEAVIKMFEEDK